METEIESEMEIEKQPEMRMQASNPKAFCRQHVANIGSLGSVTLVLK